MAVDQNDISWRQFNRMEPEEEPKPSSVFLSGTNLLSFNHFSGCGEEKLFPPSFLPYLEPYFSKRWEESRNLAHFRLTSPSYNFSK